MNPLPLDTYSQLTFYSSTSRISFTPLFGGKSFCSSFDRSFVNKNGCHAINLVDSRKKARVRYWYSNVSTCFYLEPARGISFRGCRRRLTAQITKSYRREGDAGTWSTMPATQKGESVARRKNPMKYGKEVGKLRTRFLARRRRFTLIRARAVSIVGSRCREATFCRVSAIRFESRNTEVCRVHGSRDNYGAVLIS